MSKPVVFRDTLEVVVECKKHHDSGDAVDGLLQPSPLLIGQYLNDIVSDERSFELQFISYLLKPEHSVERAHLVACGGCAVQRADEGDCF